MKYTRLVLYIVIAAFISVCGQAQAWDNHFTFTQVVAVELSDRMPVLIEKVKPEQLDTFLKQNEAGRRCKPDRSDRGIRRPL